MSHNSPTYNPYGAFELKRNYQRNLIFANVSVLALVVLIVGAIWLKDWLDDQDMVTIPLRNTDSSIHVIIVNMTPPKPVKRHVTAPKPEQPKDLGVLDKIQVTPDAPDPAPFDSTKVFTDRAAPHDQGTIQSYSDLVSDTGTGIIPSAYQPPDTTPDGPSIMPCSVLIATEPEYPYFARAKGKEGEVVIIICIDESGKLSLFPEDLIEVQRENRRSVEKLRVILDGNEQLFTVEKMTGKDKNGQKLQFNYVVTKEQPDGWFFARKLEEVLPKWEFVKPAGKALFTVKHGFCMSDSCNAKFKDFKRYTKDTTLAHIQK